MTSAVLYHNLSVLHTINKPLAVFQLCMYACLIMLHACILPIQLLLLCNYMCSFANCFKINIAPKLTKVVKVI